VACLGLIGLPFTPTFIGIDILFSHIHQHHTGIIILISLCFLFLELAALRIYARIFMGPFKKVNHPVAFPSS
jgi:NADH-quinone oxidoreductase subunit L